MRERIREFLARARAELEPQCRHVVTIDIDISRDIEELRPLFKIAGEIAGAKNIVQIIHGDGE